MNVFLWIKWSVHRSRICNSWESIFKLILFLSRMLPWQTHANSIRLFLNVRYPDAGRITKLYGLRLTQLKLQKMIQNLRNKLLIARRFFYYFNWLDYVVVSKYYLHHLITFPLTIYLQLQIGWLQNHRAYFKTIFVFNSFLVFILYSKIYKNKSH